jgi:hypothetical protein
MLSLILLVLRSQLDLLQDFGQTQVQRLILEEMEEVGIGYK